jgi:ribosomal protein S18 acetylase RimI-like enzyme
MNVIHDLNETHIVQLHRLYRKQWWSNNRSLDETKRCVAGSQIRIGLVDSQNNLVGFTRVLTDYIFKAFLFDVIVDESHRGLGLGRQLIQAVTRPKTRFPSPK